MSFAQPRRRSRLAAATGASLLTAAGLVAVTSAPALALPTGTITITQPANKKLAALTAKQVVTITVTGVGATALSEDNVESVSLGDDANCVDLDNYVVINATTLTLKTPEDGCAAGLEDVTITFTDGDLTKDDALTFVAPPAIDDVADAPVINDNSALLPTADQVKHFSTAGGQVVRVKAGGSYLFEAGAAAALAASLGGKAGTEVKVYLNPTSTVPLTTGTGTAMSFKTTAGMSGNTLVLTQNGVSKSFLDAAHEADVDAAPVVSSLTVNSGRAGATTQSTVINGKFATSLTDLQNSSKWVFNFCNKAAAVTAVNATGTAVTVTVPVISNDADGLGATKAAGSCPVTAKDVTANLTSAITGGAVYTAVVD